MPESWKDRRTEAAALRARSLQRARAGEAARARALIADFVAEAGGKIPPVRLRARSYDGRSRYRTHLSGWYLRRNQSVAVSTDGEFYILAVPSSWHSRLFGAHPEPSDPPLVLGRGARDGESIDLTDALRLVLQGRS